MKKTPSKSQKRSVEQANARDFFDELISSLTRGKRVWTAGQRMRYNRISAFLAK